MTGKLAKAGVMAERRAAVIRDAERQGLLGPKGPAVGGRLPARLVQAAKERTGIESDTELLTYALAKVALEDNFLEVLTGNQGTVPDGFFGEN